MDNIENEEGIRCVGAPVFNFDRSMAGAISLTAVHTDLPLDKVAFHASKVVESAAKISRRLGHG